MNSVLQMAATAPAAMPSSSGTSALHHVINLNASLWYVYGVEDLL